MGIYDGTQMDDLDPETQAQKAIEHTLERIHSHPSIGYYMGLGSQAFDLLTEAFATLSDTPVAAVRRQYECPNPERDANAARHLHGERLVLADLLQEALVYCSLAANDDELTQCELADIHRVITQGERAIEQVRAEQIGRAT